MNSDKWISVKDRLPRLEQVVLVCHPRGYDGKPLYSFGARIDDPDGWLWGVGPRCGTIRVGEKASRAGIEADDDYMISHWQPMPRPPFRRKEPK